MDNGGELEGQILKATDILITEAGMQLTNLTLPLMAATCTLLQNMSWDTACTKVQLSLNSHLAGVMRDIRTCQWPGGLDSHRRLCV